MPTENEIKHVLKLDDSLHYEARKLGRAFRISQGYVGKGNGHQLRIRKELESDTGLTRHYMQAKFSIQSPTARVIEISTKIPERDFKDIWRKTKTRVTKFRYKIMTGYDPNFECEEIWDVDFLKTSEGDTYFVLAEVELPEGHTEPKFEIPGFITENLVFKVPIEDTRFSNRKLSDVAYASELYRSLF